MKKKTQKIRNRRKIRGKTRVHVTKMHKGQIKAFGHVFSPMCFHCVNMSSEWEKLKVTMKKPLFVHIRMEDIGENHEENIRALNEKYNVTLESLGYPTIFRIIKSGNHGNAVEYYSGERTEKQMMKWLTH